MTTVQIGEYLFQPCTNRAHVLRIDSACRARGVRMENRIVSVPFEQFTDLVLDGSWDLVSIEMGDALVGVLAFTYMAGDEHIAVHGWAIRPLENPFRALSAVRVYLDWRINFYDVEEFVAFPIVDDAVRVCDLLGVPIRGPYRRTSQAEASG